MTAKPPTQWGIPVRIEFKHTDELWRGALLGPTGRPILRIETKRNGKPNTDELSKGAERAKREHARKLTVRIIGGGYGDRRFVWAVEFESDFIRRVKNLMLDYASERGKIYAPANYVEFFWEPNFIRKLGKRLARPRNARRKLLEKVDSILLRCWEPQGLNNMTRAKLLAWFQKHHPEITRDASLTAGALWQRFSALNLISERNPGPLQTHSR